MTNEGRHTNHRPQLTDDKTLIKLYHKEKEMDLLFETELFEIAGCNNLVNNYLNKRTDIKSSDGMKPTQYTEDDA
jgi:hypothetical protein